MPVVKEMSREELLAVISERQDQQARATGELNVKLERLQQDVHSLLMAEASRIKFYQGVQFGAQAVLVAIAAAGGAATSKIVDWLSR